jgi:hypothetical protein
MEEATTRMALGIRTRWELRRMAAATFGAFLWLQLAAPALARELAYTEIDPRRVLVYVLPLVFLAVGTLWPVVAISLLLFPTSFGAVLIVSPPAVEQSLAQPLAFTLVALTLVAYVLSAAAWPRPPSVDPLLEVTRAPLHLVHDRWRAYRGTVIPRLVLLVFAFLLTVGAVPLLPSLSERVVASFGDGDPRSAKAGLVLCNLIVFFMWAVLAYAAFVTPALELELRVRRLEGRLEATLARAHTGRRRAAFIATVLVALALMTVLLLLRYW